MGGPKDVLPWWNLPVLSLVTKSRVCPGFVNDLEVLVVELLFQLLVGRRVRHAVSQAGDLLAQNVDPSRLVSSCKPSKSSPLEHLVKYRYVFCKPDRVFTGQNLPQLAKTHVFSLHTEVKVKHYRIG